MCAFLFAVTPHDHQLLFNDDSTPGGNQLMVMIFVWVMMISYHRSEKEMYTNTTCGGNQGVVIFRSIHHLPKDVKMRGETEIWNDDTHVDDVVLSFCCILLMIIHEGQWMIDRILYFLWIMTHIVMSMPCSVWSSFLIISLVDHSPPPDDDDFLPSSHHHDYYYYP